MDKKNREWRKVYEAHINSVKWRNTREALFKMRGKICEVCKKPSLRLEVHHLTYERLGNESAKDLLIVCPDCHKKEDLKRSRIQTRKSNKKRMNAAFLTWCEKRGDVDPDEYEWDKFNDWLDKNENSGFYD